MAVWQPQREVDLVAGTPAGGGQDRPARVLIGILQSQRLIEVPIRLTNIPGRGGGNAWDHLEQRRGDPHVLAINSPTIVTNRLLGVSALDHAALTPLANLYTEYMAFVVRADSPLASGADLLARLGRHGGAPSIALATALGNMNHIALAKVTRQAGGDVKGLGIAVFDSARYAVAHVIEGRAELGVITAVSAAPELAAGTLRALAVSAPDRLPGLFEPVPTWGEHAVDCVVGTWRGVIGPDDLAAPAIAFWERVLAAATRSKEWRAALAEKYWADTYLGSAATRDFLARESGLMETVLGELGLIRSAREQGE